MLAPLSAPQSRRSKARKVDDNGEESEDDTHTTPSVFKTGAGEGNGGEGLASVTSAGGAEEGGDDAGAPPESAGEDGGLLFDGQSGRPSWPYHQPLEADEDDDDTSETDDDTLVDVRPYSEGASAGGQPAGGADDASSSAAASAEAATGGLDGAASSGSTTSGAAGGGTVDGLAAVGLGAGHGRDAHGSQTPLGRPHQQSLNGGGGAGFGRRAAQAAAAAEQHATAQVRRRVVQTLNWARLCQRSFTILGLWMRRALGAALGERFRCSSMAGQAYCAVFPYRRCSRFKG